jgi:ElaB/YqjD/DUF883 family membrane-anchored ribosome-binding protein
MEAFMKRNRVRDTVIAGVIAGVVIACGNGAAELIGEAIKDAGEALSDAGEILKDAGQRLREDAGELISDAGRQLRDAGAVLHDAGGQVLSDASDVLQDAGDALQDAGGQLLSDAGEILQDAGETTMDAGDAMLQDANAQSSCGNCNADGFQQVLTADTDWNQIQGGTVQGSDWTRLYKQVTYMNAMAYYFYKQLLDGPFVLTDVHGASGTTTYFTVEQGNDCYEEYETLTPYGTAWRIPSDSRSIIVVSSGDRIQGARILIQSNETLCTYAASNFAVADNPDITTGNKVLWSGFRPYQ